MSETGEWGDFGGEVVDRPRRKGLGALLEQARSRPELRQEIFDAAGDFGQEMAAARESLEAGKKASAMGILTGVARFVDQHPILTTILEYVPMPIPLPYGAGDYLGMMSAVHDLSEGATTKGILKLAAAVIPMVPTRPIHAIINSAYKKNDNRGV